ncbi:MAG: GHKL domain-containing protein [Dorea sp.]|nr:GHKL domain-containing protein [Dorea sp.]
MSLIQDIILTTMDAWGLLYLVSVEETSKKRKFYFVVIYIVIFCTITPFFTLSDMGMKAVFAYGIPVLLGAFLLKISVKKSLIYMVIGVTLLLLSELVIVQVGGLFSKASDLSDKVVLPIIYSTVGKIIYITLLVIVEKVLYSISNKKINIRSLVLFICSNVGYMIVSVCIYADAVSVNEKRYNILFLVCCLTIFLALVVNLISLKYYLKMENKDRDQEMIIYKLQVETRYYEEKMKEEERIKSIYHDMKNHILLLESEREEKQEWISDIKKKIMKYEDFYRTGNRFLDIILRDKIEMAQSDNIHIEDDINMDGIKMFDPFDISTIFGNLLDNAIEACKLVQEIERRVINISARRKNQLLIILVKNPKPEDRERKMRKKGVHGYGLRNVNDVVKKYGGEINIEEKESQFVVSIIIPGGKNE